MKFDPKTIDQLGYYVYLLVDPETDEPFYVGKGRANRVFEHLECKLKDDIENVKYEVIREIESRGSEVKHLIVRHGLNERTAFEVESSIIDIFRFIPKLTEFSRANIQGGIASIERGIMTTNEVRRLYDSELLTRIDRDCLIININKTYQRAKGDLSIYKATKEIWNIKEPRRAAAKYVLSEYKGWIVEVFEVDEWYSKERGYNIGAKKYGQTYMGYGFNGHVAPCQIRDKYIDKTIRPYKKRGFASVLIFPETFEKLVNGS